MARNEERQARSHETPVVGGLPDPPGIVAAMRLTVIDGDNLIDHGIDVRKRALEVLAIDPDALGVLKAVA